MTDKLDFAALKELCAKATPGPWRGARDERDANQWWGKFPKNAPECVILTDAEKLDGEEPWAVCSTSDDGLATEQEYANAKFITAARTALPALIAEHERLTAALAATVRTRDQYFVEAERNMGTAAALQRERDQAREQLAEAQRMCEQHINLWRDDLATLDQAREQRDTLARLLVETRVHIARPQHNPRCTVFTQPTVSHCSCGALPHIAAVANLDAEIQSALAALKGQEGREP